MRCQRKTEKQRKLKNKENKDRNIKKEQNVQELWEK